MMDLAVVAGRAPTRTLAISAAGVTTVLAIAVHRWYCGRRPSSPTPPTERPWPVVEGALPLLGHAHLLANLSRLTLRVTEWAYTYGDDPGVFEFRIFGKTFLAVCRFDRMDELSHLRPHLVVRSSNSTSMANGIGAKGVFAAEGSQWKMDRRLFGPPLNYKNIREDYFRGIRRVAERLVKKWQIQCKKQKETNADRFVVIHQDMYAYSMDALSVTVFGQDANTLEVDDDPSLSNGRDSGSVAKEKTALRRSVLLKEIIGCIGASLETAMTRMLSPVRFWEIPIVGPYLDGGAFATNRLVQLANKLIADYGSTAEGQSVERETARTFLGKLYALHKESESTLPKERLLGNVVTVFLTGNESTANTLIYALNELAQDDTGLQEELHKEIHDLGDDLSVYDLDELRARLPLVCSFLHESVRVLGAFPFVFLGAAEDIPFLGGVISKGTDILLMNHYIANRSDSHAAPDIPVGPNGELPCEFCARRWIQVCCDGSGEGDPSITVKSTIPSSTSPAHLHFGWRVRTCPGRNLSETQMMLAIVYVVKHFCLDVASTTCQDHCGSGRLFLEPRSSNST